MKGRDLRDAGIARVSIGRDLLQALVQEIKLLPDVWPKLSQKKQDDVIDRLDVLDMKGREDLIAWLDILAQDGEINTALIFGTLKALPANLPQTMAAHWLENGVVAQLKEAA